MKKSALVLVLLCSGLIAHADTHPWAVLTGCYDTLARNGYAVEKGPQPTLSVTQLKQESSEVFTDPSGNKIDAFDFMLFQKYSAPDQTYYFDYFSAFSDRGQYTQDQAGFHYNFAGKLKITGYANEFTLQETIDVQQQTADILTVHLSRHVPEAGTYYDVSDIYILKKTVCP